MNTAVITAKTDVSTKKNAQKLARELGIPLSSVVNALLKQFIRTKSLNLSLEEDLELTNWAKVNLKKSLGDLKKGDSYSFENVDEAISFLNSDNLEKINL